LAPCFRKKSNASGGNFVLAMPYLTWGLRHSIEVLLTVEGVLGKIRSVKAIGYVRVSTEQQADWGVSLEAQTEKVRAMAVVQGAQSLEVIVDAESAKSLNRSGMTRLLSLVDAGEVDVVIIAKLDRLTRSPAAITWRSACWHSSLCAQRKTSHFAETTFEKVNW
jgi:Resolvase, N terminal domain